MWAPTLPPLLLGLNGDSRTRVLCSELDRNQILTGKKVHDDGGVSKKVHASLRVCFRILTIWVLR